MSGKLIYIVGSGGRESALADALRAEEVVLYPDTVTTLSAVDDERPDLVVIGSEQPLVEGLADILRVKKIPVFGPSKQAAQLEGSKAFTEEFLERHNIPRPHSHTVTRKNVSSYKIPDDVTGIVLKADGLAAGKGVVLPKTQTEAKDVLQAMLSGTLLGDAGSKVVVQERLHGPEVSVFVLSDGVNMSILPYTQDHKRLKDNDVGPNTGGMGAYAPVPSEIVSQEQSEEISVIAEQSIRGMFQDGMPFRGVLYIGLILAEERGGSPVVIEYNVRFGDPEAQVLLPFLESSGVDMYSVLKSTDDTLLELPPDNTDVCQLTVCLAADGYPTNPKKGDQIFGLDKKYKSVRVYTGSVARRNAEYYTDGGRVLYITGSGKTIDEAANCAYSAIGPRAIHFDGMQYRSDIGWQARSNSVVE